MSENILRNSPKNRKPKSWPVILLLSFQSLGVVYGDLGTSPLYVYASTFSHGIKHNDDIFGVLSMIIYTLTLIPLIKYVFILLHATHNGDGGTFALYSLICRYTKMGLIPSEDRDVELPNSPASPAKYFLLFATMLATSMVIGDGVLTPCISVLSAVGGIKQATDKITDDMMVWISVAILICLFVVQRFGTEKVGYSFAPIICVWFAFMSGIGLYNFFKYDPSVIKALNPIYVLHYFKRNKFDAWISLGGVVLAITGTEALFADVGHFTAGSIQISMCFVTYPALLCAYAGQAAFLRKNNDLVSETFYKSIPDPLYWPMCVLAVMASVIASQSMISGTFSIIQQSLSLGCFPRVKIVHTCTKYEGQVYIPEINYILMLACIFVTLGFRNTANIGNAYGIAVVFVMTLTSGFIVVIMLMIWKTRTVYVIVYVLSIGVLELVFLSSVAYKFKQGGYLPLAFSAVLMSIMLIWNYVHRMKYNYELKNKISLVKLKKIADPESYFSRLPGLAMFYSDNLVQGIPPTFYHYAQNLRALHSVLVFVSIKSLPVGKVPEEERLLFQRVQVKELNVFLCVARYGYIDGHRNEQEPAFDVMLIQKLKQFIQDEFVFNRGRDDDAIAGKDHAYFDSQIQMVDKAWRDGVYHLVAENDVVAKKGSNIGKRILIDYAFAFLNRNVRQISNKWFDIPQDRVLQLRVTYQL